MISRLVLSGFLFMGLIQFSHGSELDALAPSCESTLAGNTKAKKAKRWIALAAAIYASTLPVQADQLIPANPAISCAARPTDIVGSLGAWRDAWKVAERGWTMDHGDYSTRSSYELYSRYNGLAFVLGITPEDMMGAMRVVGQLGPEVQRNWNWEDYARMGEAAVIRGKSIVEAMEYLKAVYASSDQFWNYLDYSRAAAAGYIADVPPAQVMRTLKESYAMSRGWWTNGTFSRLAEGALISGTSAATAAKMLDEVYAAANRITPGWFDDDYARIARAALIMNISGEQAVRVLADTYRETIKISSGWHYRDYSRMASAAIITQKSAKEAARALKDTWDSRAVSRGWDYADYSMVAAAALIGKGTDPDVQCPRFYKAW